MKPSIIVQQQGQFIKVKTLLGQSNDPNIK